MNTYVTGSTIRQLREAKGLTQAELAGTLSVSAKTISKWETAKGLPDISLLEPLAAALGVSVLELMQGEPIINRNRAANLLRSKLYVCPLCGNVLHATGQAVVRCCGITLPALDIAEAEDADEHHQLTVERVEDELFVTLHHPMEKNHYISFLAYLTGDKLQLVKLYPEGDASARFSLRGAGVLYFYCNCHGLMKAPDFRTATRRTSPQKIHLREPDEGDREQVMAYREEFLAIGSRMDGTSALDKYADFDAWLAQLRKLKDPATTPAGLVPATEYLALDEHEHLVGDQPAPPAQRLPADLRRAHRVQRPPLGAAERLRHPDASPDAGKGKRTRHRKGAHLLRPLQRCLSKDHPRQRRRAGGRAVRFLRWNADTAILDTE